MILMCLPAALEMTVAPDQPMPFVYSDDPLILEIYSDTEGQVSGSLEFTSIPGGEKTEVTVEPFHIHAKSGYWYAVEKAPAAKGYFNLGVNLACGADTLQKTFRYCRIDRPTLLQHLPVYAHCSGDNQTCVLPAVRSVGIGIIHFTAANEYLGALTDEVAHLGLHFILSLSPGELQKIPEYLKPVIEGKCENILRFEVDCTGVDADCGAALREAGCPAGMSLVVKDANDFAQAMGQTSNLPTRYVSLVASQWPDAEEVRRIRYIAAQYGQEGSQIHVACPNWYPRSDEESPGFLHRFFRYRAANASHVGLNASVLADDMGVQEMMAYLNGLALHFSGQSYVGNCLETAGVETPLFRNGADWLAVIWAKKRGTAIALPIDGAINLALYDAVGNVLELDASGKNGQAIECGPVPLYLKGTGGALLGRAAVNQLKAQTAHFLAQTELRGSLPPNVVELVQKIQAEPSSPASRLNFLELVGVLPWLEEQWHTRQLPKHVVVPAIMLLSDISKTMAIIEEDRGEVFLEPLSDTLARTEESQSLYLTGSAGTAKSRERGDWILAEVRRLVEEAEGLDLCGRKIEAGAVAALAEVRGQCLKSAAQAEIVEETPGLVPVPAPAPEAVATMEGEAEGPVETPKKEEKKEVKPAAEGEAESAETEVAAQEGDIVHVVASGDNPYNIAKKYKIKLDDLLEWNNLTKKSVLQIGQKLVVHGKKSE